jgi:putative ABC transport system substrate-binding protein
MLYCPGVNRRHFLLTSLTGAIAAPRVVAAQRQAAATDRLSGQRADHTGDRLVLGRVRGGPAEHGWVQPRSIVIERRYLELGMEPAIAAVEELSRIGVEVIVVSSTQVALAAKQATRTLPIVMTIPSDPVAVGLVASLARPGGNTTGISILATELDVNGRSAARGGERAGVDRGAGQPHEPFPPAPRENGSGDRPNLEAARRCRRGQHS